MNQEIKQQWVAALRSGDYRQGTGALKNDRGEFCCLGVLCDLAEKSGIVSWKDDVVYPGYVPPDCDLIINSTLPLEVKVWAEVSSVSPAVQYAQSFKEGLSELNDTHKLSFAEIADIIEAQL